MNVFYNFELDEDLEVVNKKPESAILFTDLKQGIIDRLGVLKDDIESEENEGYKMIVIIWPINQEKVPLGIEYFHYSDNLIARMKQSLSREYIEYLFKQISDRFDTFNQ